MNCPKCRKKMTYWPEFSDPQTGHLVYSCYNCLGLYSFFPQTLTSKALASYRGYRILKLKLKKYGYAPPPLPKRSDA